VIKLLKARQSDRAAHQLPLELGFRAAVTIYAWRTLGMVLNAIALLVVSILADVCIILLKKDHWLYALLVACAGTILTLIGGIITGSWVAEAQMPREVRIALIGFSICMLVIAAPITLFVLDKVMP
jgi:hypothetical protein